MADYTKPLILDGAGDAVKLRRSRRQFPATRRCRKPGSAARHTFADGHDPTNIHESRQHCRLIRYNQDNVDVRLCHGIRADRYPLRQRSGFSGIDAHAGTNHRLPTARSFTAAIERTARAKPSDSLSSSEQTELDEFLRMNRFMSRLKLKARQKMTPPPAPPRIQGGEQAKCEFSPYSFGGGGGSLPPSVRSALMTRSICVSKSLLSPSHPAKFAAIRERISSRFGFSQAGLNK